MLLLNKTLLRMAKGLWGWIFLITALKLLTLVGTAAFARLSPGFWGFNQPPDDGGRRGQAVISALMTALLLLGAELLTGEAEYRCTAKAGFPAAGHFLQSAGAGPWAISKGSAPFPPLHPLWTGWRPCRSITANTCRGYFTAWQPLSTSSGGWPGVLSPGGGTVCSFSGAGCGE